MKENLLNKIIPVIKDHYLENKKLKQIDNFEIEIEMILIDSFKSTFGSGGTLLRLSNNLLVRWNKDANDICQYLNEQGFVAQVLKGNCIDVEAPTLRKEMIEFSKLHS